MRTDRSAAKITHDDLLRALGHDDFVLLYQPIVSASTVRTVGLEALVRMKLPSGDLASPDEFIRLAEDTGLVCELGEWALQRACADGQRWPALRVSVNVSPRQLHRADFVNTVQRILDKTGLPPERLELEVTEHCPIDDFAQAQNCMMALRETGVRLALDDFGVGYSSLIYLRKLPLDKIKIDRAFVESMETRKTGILVRSIVRLGHDLGLTVTAEGVETIEHQSILAEAGCHELQGYLFSRPLPAGDIDTLFGRPEATPRLRMAGAA